MLIKELYLKNFGCFREKKFLFGEGINVIQGNNGTGKTTLHTFVKGMFFGIEKQRGRLSKKDTYTLYEPWDEFANYYGKIRFQIDGRNFLLERSFYRLDKRAVLRNEDDGEVLSLEQGDLTAILDGLTENSYVNTISIGQLKGETDLSLADELKNYIVNYNQTGDNYINIAVALQKLEEEKKKWESKSKQLKQNKENETLKMNAMLSFMEQERNETYQQYELLKDTYHKQQKEIGNPEDIIHGNKIHQGVENEGIRKQAISEKVDSIKKQSFLVSNIAFSIFLVIGMVFLMVSKNILYKGVMVSAIVVAFGMLKLLHGIIAGRKQNRETSNSMQTIVDTKPTDIEIKELDWKIKNLWEIIKEKEIAIENIKEELEELVWRDDRLSHIEEEINAIQEAFGKIQQAAKKMEEKVGSSFEEKASAYLKEITQGKYEKLYVTDKLSMSVQCHEKIVNIEQLSRGTIDLIYFCFRLAVAELLYPNVNLPILLDDAFSMCDEERLTRILMLLSQKNRQILLFSCHEREHKMLTSLGVAHNYIKLV